MVSIGGAAGRADTPAMLLAKQALATADAMVEQDRRNHSPSCVAVDQKQVDKATLQLAQASSASPPVSADAPAGGLGRLLDMTV